MLASGSEQRNAAAVNVSYDEGENGPEVEAQVLQKGMTGQAVDAGLSVNGKPVAHRQIMLEKDATRAAFPVTLHPGDAYQVAISQCDSLRIDDVVCGVVSAIRQRVTLVTKGNVPLEQALLSIPQCELQVLRHSDVVPPGDSVVVVDGESPQGLAPDCGCGFLFIGAPDPFGWTSNDGWITVGQATHWSEGHPLFQDVSPLGYRVGRAVHLAWQGSGRCDQLLGCSEGPIMIELQPAWPGGQPPKCLYWLFDLGRSNLSGKASFPVLIANAIAYLSIRDSSVWPDAIQTGQPLRLGRGDIPVVTDPSGNPCKPQFSGDGWLVLKTMWSGFYTWHRPGASSVIPINIDSQQGVQPMPLGSDRPAGAEAGTTWLSRLKSLSSHTLIALCLFLMIAEWTLFMRRVIQI